MALSENVILEICKIEKLEGLTIHGGEPLDQANELIKVVELLKENSFTVILFTGYIKKELNNVQLKVWNKSDLVVAGRFENKKRNVNLQFRGSTNQRVYKYSEPYKNYKLTDGYTTAIITIYDDGNMDINGFLTEDVSKLIVSN